MTNRVKSTAQNMMQNSNFWDQLQRATYATTKYLNQKEMFLGLKLWTLDM